MRRSLLLLLLVPLVAACSNNTVTTKTVALPASRSVPTPLCAPGDATMNCVLAGLPTPVPKSGLAPSTYGIDFGWGAPSCGTLQSLRAKFGASYLSYDASKDWTRASVDRLHACGVATVNVWEAGASDATQGRSVGYSQAVTARDEARALGEPDNRPIDYAIDCDCSVASVFYYFVGVDEGTAAVLHISRAAAVQLVGAYGGYDQILGLYDNHVVGHTNWQTYAWSGGRFLPASIAPLEQYLNGNAYDNDRAIAVDYGQYPFRVTPPKPRLICFGPRASSSSACKSAKATVVKANRAIVASQRAYNARGCEVLIPRRNWFANQLRKHPHVKAAHRHQALTATRRAISGRSCLVFSGRVAYFDHLITATERNHTS